jgi:hypothetical protein
VCFNLSKGKTIGGLLKKKKKKKGLLREVATPLLRWGWSCSHLNFFLFKVVSQTPHLEKVKHMFSQNILIRSCEKFSKTVHFVF